MKRTLSLFSANLLYAVTMLLVVTVGSLIQQVQLSWGLIATEVLLIALPAVLFLRKSRVSLKSGLRLRPIAPISSILCVVLGIAMYLVGIVIDGVMAQLTGLQPVPIESNLLPKTPVEIVIFSLALAIAAPVCEEMLFRGAIQTAYESQKSARFAITVVALMFAFYHLRLSGLPALLPIAFVLGFVAWRTGSIYASILVHFGNNGMSALQTIAYFSTGKALPFISLWSALAGLLVAIAILALFVRRYPRPVSEAGVDEVQLAATSIRRRWLAAYWPLMLAGALYAGVSLVTLAPTITTRAAPSTDIAYGMPSLSSIVVSRYDIANKGGQPVGDMVCRLSPQPSAIQLDCTRTIHAYEYKAGSSFYKDSEHEDSLNATWDAKSMVLIDFSYERKAGDGSSWNSKAGEGKLISTDGAGGQMVELGQDALLEFEWAWHAALMKANSGTAFSVPFAKLMTWNESAGKSMPAVKPEILKVHDDEVLALPGRSVLTRKVTLAGAAAWYARADAVAGLPRPVKLDDGVLVYTLVGGPVQTAQ